MLDGYYKTKIDLFWNKLAKALVYIGLTPNQITWLGLILMAVNCLAYAFHKNDFWYQS